MIPAVPLGRRLRCILTTPIRTAAAVPGADAYRKHFPASAHLWFLVWHTLSASPSLRQSHASANADPGFWTQLGLPPTGVSRSQLTRSSTSRPLGCAETLLATLQQQVPAAARVTPDWGRVQLVDSTFVTLSAQLSPWSQHGRHAPGLRVHTGVNLATGIPDQLHFTLADTHDIRAFRDRAGGGAPRHQPHGDRCCASGGDRPSRSGRRRGGGAVSPALADRVVLPLAQASAGGASPAGVHPDCGGTHHPAGGDRGAGAGAAQRRSSTPPLRYRLGAPARASPFPHPPAPRKRLMRQHWAQDPPLRCGGDVIRMRATRSHFPLPTSHKLHTPSLYDGSVQWRSRRKGERRCPYRFLIPICGLGGSLIRR